MRRDTQTQPLHTGTPNKTCHILAQALFNLAHNVVQVLGLRDCGGDRQSGVVCTHACKVTCSCVYCMFVEHACVVMLACTCGARLCTCAFVHKHLCVCFCIADYACAYPYRCA